MWLLLPAVYLAIAHIAGDNVAVVPDLAALSGTKIYITTLLAYMIFGSIIAGLLAWIGIKTGQELLVVVNRLFGCSGKKILAMAILGVCLPASALTGGYYSGWVFSQITGLPLAIGIPFSLALACILAIGHGNELLKLSNYCGFLLVPLIIFTIISYEIEYLPSIQLGGSIDWVFVFALVGYNVGGMRPVLVVETAAHLSQKGWQAIYLIIIAKLLEGILTIVVAHLVILTGAQGPLALAGVFKKVWSIDLAFIFNLVLFCTFLNTMAPAMMVNAKQLSCLSGLNFRQAIILSAVIVCILSFTDFNIIIRILSCTGIIMAGFIIYTAYFLHKKGEKQS